MTVTRTTLLNLPIITTGTEPGLWGDYTNNGLTEYIDTSVAGALSITASITLANTTGTNSATGITTTTAQYRTLVVPAAGVAANVVITAPSSNRTYHVVNRNATYTVQIRAGANSGITFGVNQSGTVTYNSVTGDYELVGPIGPTVPVARGGTGTTTLTGLVKGNGTNAFTAAVSGTDYAPATSGTSILYGNGAGGFSNVTIGTGVSFAAGTLSATGTGGTVTAVSVTSANGLAGTSSGGATPALTLRTTITGVLKGNGTAISAAVSGTDYAPATSGTSILYGTGSGGFSNVTIGSNLTFAGGTLSASGGGSWSVITTTTTASSGAAYLVDTSAGSFTVSLPASPSTGAAVTFSDRSYTWDRYPVTIGRNGQTIETLSEDMICSIQEASFTLVFDGSTWRLV